MNRNDLRQYDDLAGEWWRPGGEFAALHWIARARASLIPAAQAPAARLLDIACGGGLLAPHVRGYEHVGIDLVASALRAAREHGVTPVLSDATALPFADGVFDVVVAGEVLEHVADPEALVAEACRVLAPGGTVVVDTIAATRWASVSMVTIGEWLPGGPPRGCHDRALFVDPARLRRTFGEHGVRLRLRGLAPHPLRYLWFVLTRRGHVPMRPSRSLSGLYQGWGRKPMAGRGVHPDDIKRQ
jgi:2-polyprenyl-6-hydroxyphenyl methylase/3-demethylubiquinone-9 3-methyltransferase